MAARPAACYPRAMTAPAPNPSRQLAAEAWVQMRELLDLQLSPLGLAAMDALAPQAGETLLDIGCGAGQTVLQLAERVGPEGQVIGVDIAPQLLALARRDARDRPQARFIATDAQTLALPDHSADGLYSRFGVMAFADPVLAFANFHRILKPAGRLAFVCWRALEDNELDRLPLRAAGLEDRLDPTPFSFADPDHIVAILRSAGFVEIDVRPYDERVSSGDLEAMLAVLLKVGPLGRILRETPALRPAAEPRVRAALAARGTPDQIALNAATWIVTARASKTA